MLWLGQEETSAQRADPSTKEGASQPVVMADQISQTGKGQSHGSGEEEQVWWKAGMAAVDLCPQPCCPQGWEKAKEAGDQDGFLRCELLRKDPQRSRRRWLYDRAEGME